MGRNFSSTFRAPPTNKDVCSVKLRHEPRKSRVANEAPLRPCRPSTMQRVLLRGAQAITRSRFPYGTPGGLVVACRWVRELHSAQQRCGSDSASTVSTNETHSCPVCFSQDMALAHRKRWRSFQLGAGRHEKESWDYLRCGCVQLARRPMRDLWLL